MTDLASLVLAVDSTQVKGAVASLDGLTAAGARAEAATVGLAASGKGAGVAAAAMAVQAQAASRAATGMATGFKASSDAARINTMAMRETLVVARELSRGNLTRLPGSLTLLAQGISAQGAGIGGYLSSLGQMFGIIKKVQNAELAEAATNAAVNAQAIEGAAKRAASAGIAADAEIALATAEQELAVTTAEASAAQARLAAATAAASAAAGEAAIAERALAGAYAKSAEAQALSAAATRTMIGGAGVGLLGIGTVAIVAYGAIKQFQDEVKDGGALDAYADKLNLTDAQIKKLGGSVTYLGHNIREVHGLTVSFGDVMHSVWHEIAREVSDAGPWNALEKAATSAFSSVLSAWNKVSAGISAGLMFIIDAGKAALNGSLFTKFDPMADIKSRYTDELKRNAEAFGNIKAGAISHAEARMQSLSDGNNPRAPKKAKKESDHGLQEALDKLDAEIKGQYALAAAYAVSDAAAQQAAAHQKAAEDAIQHKGAADLFYARELQKSVAEDVAAHAKQNADLQFETSKRAQLNGAIADGTLTVEQANEKMKLEIKLRSLNNDLLNADAAHRAAVNKVIQDTIDLNTENLALQAQLNALTQIAANDNDIARLTLENRLLGASNKERAVALAQLQAKQELEKMDPNGLLTAGERNNYIQSAAAKARLSVQEPFQQWAASIPQTADAVNEALQRIQVQGFDNLANAITDVITGTKSLKAAFSEVAKSIIHEIIMMTVRMLIFRAVSAAFGGGASSALLTNNGSTAPITQVAKGGAFSGGNVIPFASGGVIGSPTMFGMSGGRTGLMGEAGPEAVMPLARDSSGKLGVRGGNQGPIEVHVTVEASDDLLVKAAVVADSRINAAEPRIVRSAANATMRVVTRPALMGRR